MFSYRPMALSLVIAPEGTPSTHAAGNIATTTLHWLRRESQKNSVRRLMLHAHGHPHNDRDKPTPHSRVRSHHSQLAHSHHGIPFLTRDRNAQTEDPAISPMFNSSARVISGPISTEDPFCAPYEIAFRAPMLRTRAGTKRALRAVSGNSYCGV